jgi:hypothetical protein
MVKATAHLIPSGQMELVIASLRAKDGDVVVGYY